jgi:hypothetical protein
MTTENFMALIRKRQVLKIGHAEEKIFCADNSSIGIHVENYEKLFLVILKENRVRKKSFY